MKIMFDFHLKLRFFKEHLNICSIRTVNDLLFEVFPFVSMCLFEWYHICSCHMTNF